MSIEKRYFTSDLSSLSYASLTFCSGMTSTSAVEGQLIVNGMLNERLQAALDGFGLAYMPEDVVKPDIAAGRLIAVLEDWCAPFPGYHLYYTSRRQMSPAFRLLVDALRYRK